MGDLLPVRQTLTKAETMLLGGLRVPPLMFHVKPSTRTGGLIETPTRLNDLCWEQKRRFGIQKNGACHKANPISVGQEKTSLQSLVPKHP